MHRVLLSLLTFVSLNFGLLNAKDLNYTDTDDFKKMADIINSVLSSDLGKDDFITGRSYPKVDIQDKDDAYIYHFNLAGTEKKDIKLRRSNRDHLILEGKVENKNKTSKDGYTKQEIFHGSFKKTVELAQDADLEKLTTKYNNGILTIHIPKKELENISSKLIPIN